MNFLFMFMSPENRIKYTRDTLLKFYGEKSTPLRLQDILTVHDIILKVRTTRIIFNHEPLKLY